MWQILYCSEGKIVHKFIGHVKSYCLDNYVHVAPKPNCIMLYGRDNTLNINKQSVVSVCQST